MSVEQILLGFENLPLSNLVRESTWLFPAIETVHVLAITLVVGTILRVDLRLLSVWDNRKGARSVLSELLIWTWTAFVVAAASGILMFCSHATKYAGIPQFQLKIGIMALAAINMLIFHIFPYRQIRDWDVSSPPNAAKASALVSLIAWVSIVGLGRWIGFT